MDLYLVSILVQIPSAHRKHHSFEKCNVDVIGKEVPFWLKSDSFDALAHDTIVEKVSVTVTHKLANK